MLGKIRKAVETQEKQEKDCEKKEIKKENEVIIKKM